MRIIKETFKVNLRIIKESAECKLAHNQKTVYNMLIVKE